MYLHLGGDVVVRTKDIIGIFDIENSSIARSTKSFLTKAQKSGQVVNVTNELPKSFILCENGGNVVLYISQISSATLRKRSSFVQGLSKL